ncbi:uncharacterized protein LOC144715886 [Wolffia australiana]
MAKLKVSNGSNSVSNISNICTNVNSIPMLDGSNFKKWKEFVTLYLDAMDLGYALRNDQPKGIKDSSVVEEKNVYDTWERSNHMSLMVIKCTIPEFLRDTVSEEATKAKVLPQDLEKRYYKSDRAEISTLMNRLTTMRCKRKGNRREYIIKMSQIRSKLKALCLELPKESIRVVDDPLARSVTINSLPIQFNQLKVSYNCQRDLWSLNELILHCVQEEERLKSEKCESAHLTVVSKGKFKDKGKRKGYQVDDGPPKKKQHTDRACFFCKCSRHMKKECAKYLAWCK